MRDKRDVSRVVTKVALIVSTDIEDPDQLSHPRINIWASSVYLKET